MAAMGRGECPKTHKAVVGEIGAGRVACGVLIDGDRADAGRSRCIIIRIGRCLGFDQEQRLVGDADMRRRTRSRLSNSTFDDGDGSGIASVAVASAKANTSSSPELSRLMVALPLSP